MAAKGATRRDMYTWKMCTADTNPMPVLGGKEPHAVMAAM